MSQPLFKVVEVPGNRPCKLVPSLCQLVGLTEGMKRNRMISREVKQVAKVDAPIAVQRAQDFIQIMKNQLKNGLFDIQHRPRKVVGKKLEPGYLIQGER